MKKSFYPKLALDGIRKNKRMYFPYILTGAVMVMMFYILRFLVDTPALASIKGGSVLSSILPLGCGVVAVFSLLFLFYTNSFLIKQRYREFGLYNVLGMDKINISRLMLWETFWTSGISIISGLVCGMAFSKAAELILLNILDAEITFNFNYSVSAIVVTALIYLAIYVLLLFNALIKVRISKPLQLMQKSSVGEKKIKCNWLFAVGGVVLLGIAYFIAVSIEEPLAALQLFFAAVLMVIIGTYLLFISGSVALCKLLQKNKKYYYNPKHFVSVSSMTYRMKRNGAGLASICILLTMVLVMLSSTASLYFGEEDSLNKRYPNGVNITYDFDTLDGIGDESLNKQRKIIERYAPKGADLRGTRYAVTSGQFTDDGIILDYEHIDKVDYNRVGNLFIVSLDDYNTLMGEKRTLSDGECFIYTDRLKTTWETFNVEFCEPCKVREQLTNYKADVNSIVSTVPSVFIVVNDVMSFVEPLKDIKNMNGFNMLEYTWILGLDYDTAEEEIATKQTIHEAIVKNTDDTHPFKKLSSESREEERFEFYEVYGSLFFIGIMLSVVFLMAAVLIIYYKQISEGYEDQSRFEIMQNVGMTKKDIRKSINSQMLTVFFLPLVMAGLHLGFAFPCISKILKLFLFDNIMFNIIVTIACFLIFGVFYGIVYKITSGSYYAIVSGRKESQ